MKSVHLACIATLTLSAAAFAGPVFAADATDGPKLSDRAVPIEPPKIEAGDVTRDLELDPQKIENNMGVMRKTNGGGETRMPAADSVKKAIEGGGDNRGIDPLDGEQGRQVFGDDDRVQITNSEGFPARTIGLLQATTPNGYGTCSATLIGPRTVVTAAHCLYNHEEGWRDEFLFAPGLLAMDNAPFGVYEYEDAYIVSGFIDNYQGFYGSVVPWDLGVVILKEPIGDKLGWMEFDHDDSNNAFVANIIGYPGDKPAGTMWHVACEVGSDAMNETNYAYLCDTYPGSSGSSVYKYMPDANSRVVYGINVAENPQFNTAVRINPTYYAWLKNLVQ